MSKNGYEGLLTCGTRLRKVLLDDAEFRAMTDRVIPVVTQIDQPLPFVTYFRAGVSMTPVKGTRGPASVNYQFQIYTAEWPEGARIAARVLEVLDGYADEDIRSCVLTDSVENHDPSVPAFMQVLTFEVRPR